MLRERANEDMFMAFELLSTKVWKISIVKGLVTRDEVGTDRQDNINS